ncbi:MAG: hypothetical protein NWP49_05900 [Litorivicinaceae bacterium]|nr:hypothetical protein [Litorivicinaceae bacterium]
MSAQMALNAHLHLIKVMPKKLSLMIASLGPIEIPRRYGDDPRDGLVGVVIGQQVSAQAARAIRERVFTSFASREALYAAAQRGQLDAHGLSKAKQKTIQFISLLSDIKFSQWQNLAYPQRLTEMTQVPGIGPWTVAMWSIFVCQDPDCWSDGDLILRTRMDGLAQEAQINRQQMLRQAEPYRTYLALYLWAFKDQLPRESTIP